MSARQAKTDSALPIERIDWLIIVALREELNPLVPLIRRRTTRRIDSVRVTIGELAGRRVAACRTGIGRDLALEKSRILCRELSPRFIFAGGFGGAIDPTLRPGDVVIAEEVIEIEGSEAAELTGIETWDTQLLHADLLSVDGLRAQSGRLVTSRSVLRTAEEKRRVGAALDARIVDMESAGIAQSASEHSIPLVCARVVLDECSFELPFDFGRILTPEGRVKPLAAACEFGRRPLHWPALARLRERTIQASAVLAQFVPALIDATDLGKNPR